MPAVCDVRDETMKTPGRAIGLLGVVLVLSSAFAVPPGTAAAQSDAPEFERSIVRADQGAVAEIPVTVPDASDAFQVVVGSEEVNFLVIVTVEDADGDGSVVLSLDTEIAGSGSPREYLSASDGDEIHDATQETPELDSGRPLGAGNYDLAIGPREDPVTLGTLVVAPTTAGTETERTREQPTWEPRERETVTDDGDTVLVYEGEEIVVESATDRIVRGDTTLDPGTRLTVRVRGAGEHPFLETAETEVTEFGTFSAAFDFDDVPRGASFEITVRRDGAVLASATGRVIDCEGRCPTPTEQKSTAFETLDGDELAVAPLVEVTRSRIARIPVSFGDADAVTVVVGGPEVNYEISGTARDRDGDGRAVVLFRTEAAGFEPPTLAVQEGDGRAALEGVTESSLKSLLAAGDYPVELYRGTEAVGEPDAVGTVVVQEAPPAVGTPTPEPTRPPESTTTGPGSETQDDSTDAITAVALGGVLSVLGIGLLLGRFRS